MTLICAIPGRAYGARTVNLELKGSGSTAWNITDIKPGDADVQYVELHNVGNSAGWVAIWISDIAESDHGGDKARLDDYLLFNLSCSRLSANLTLPATIRQFPASPLDANYLTIDSLGVGENVTLVWQWRFPETGLPQDDAQGDTLSFTINYQINPSSIGGSGGGSSAPKSRWLQFDMLGHITEVLTNLDGKLLRSFTAADATGENTMQFDAGTTAVCTDGKLPSIIKMKTCDEAPAAPDGTEIIGPVYEITGLYRSNQHPLTFSLPVRLTLSYDSSKPSDNASINIGYYDAASGWKILESPPETAPTPGKVSALITQTSMFAVLATLAPVPPPETTPPPPDTTGLPPEPDTPTTEPGIITPVPPQRPAHFELSGLVIEPARPEPGEPVSISGRLWNKGGLQGSFTVELKINGQAELSRKINLAGGDSTRVSFTVVRNVPGIYDVTLGSLSGEFIVLAPALADSGARASRGILALIVAAAGLLVYLILVRFWLSPR